MTLLISIPSTAPLLSRSRLPLPLPTSFFSNPPVPKPSSLPLPSSPSPAKMSWLGKLGLGFSTRAAGARAAAAADSRAAAPDDDVPAPGQVFAQFAGGCFWGVELAFQRGPGVSTTEVGYSQGLTHAPTYEDVCTGTTNHAEVVRVQYDPSACRYEDLLDVFWSKHDPTTPNRQGNDVGTQYRSGIYFYTPEQEKVARVAGKASEDLKQKDSYGDPSG